MKIDKVHLLAFDLESGDCKKIVRRNPTLMLKNYITGKIKISIHI